MKPLHEGELRAEDLRPRFTDPDALTLGLGLQDGGRRESGGWKVLCPWHGERHPSCSVTRGQDGTVRVHCFSCDATSDALGLIAQVRGLDPKGDFPRILQEAADLLGAHPSAARKPPPPRQRPPAKEVAQLWHSCLPPQVGDQDLLRRGLDPALLSDRDLVRTLPPGALPRWASFRRSSWLSTGHRWVVPMYGPTGDLESLHARILGQGQEPKALSPAGCLLGGLVLADAAGRELLRTGKAPGRGVVIVEGVPDFLTVASLFSDADADAPAVLGVISGSWSRSFAQRLPEGAKVLIWTHTDAAAARAGQRYAEVIAKDIGARCQVRVVRQSAPPGAKKAPDANDLLQQGGCAAVLAVMEGGATPDRPKVEVTARIDLSRDAAVRALAGGAASLYHREGALVDVLAGPPPVIREVPRGHLTALLAQVADWWRGDKLVSPPREVVAAVAELGDWPGLRRLRAAVDHPVLRPDGSLLEQPGYDPATCLLYHPRGTFLPVPPHPSLDEASAQARWLLSEVVGQFPFEHPAGPSAWLASLLSILVRHAHDGPAPLFLIDGNLRGTGKTLLADVASLIATGQDLAKLGPGKDEDETEKRITAIGLAGNATVLFDNILRPLGNPALDKALTTTLYQGRLLGRSDAQACPRVPLYITWFATGNNVRLAGDMGRRIVRLRLLSPHERPEQIQGFRHKDLRAWVLQHRPQLLRAALLVLRGWYAAGAPRFQLPQMGSFEAWSDIVRQAICWVGLPDPLACNDQGADDMDEEAQVLPELLEGLELIQGEIGEGWFSTAELVRRLTARSEGRHIYPLTKLRDALGELLGDRPIDSRSIGYRLRKYNGRIASGRRLMPARTGDQKGWRVERISPASPASPAVLTGTQPSG